MISKTLRIKKIYFDRILAGEKTSEYRADSDYYRSIFRDLKAPFNLRLHYQGGVFLDVKVKSLRKIRRPERIKPENVPTIRCFELVLDPKSARISKAEL